MPGASQCGQSVTAVCHRHPRWYVVFACLGQCAPVIVAPYQVSTPFERASRRISESAEYPVAVREATRGPAPGAPGSGMIMAGREELEESGCLGSGGRIWVSWFGLGRIWVSGFGLFGFGLLRGVGKIWVSGFGLWGGRIWVSGFGLRGVGRIWVSGFGRVRVRAGKIWVSGFGRVSGFGLEESGCLGSGVVWVRAFGFGLWVRALGSGVTLQQLLERGFIPVLSVTLNKNIVRFAGVQLVRLRVVVSSDARE